MSRHQTTPTSPRRKISASARPSESVSSSAALTISAPTRLTLDDKVRLTYEVRCPRDVAWPETLWFEVEPEHAELLTDTCDPAVAALLLPAMVTGRAIRVRGPMSARLLYQLGGAYQRLLLQVMPWLESVSIDADAVDARKGRASGVATGFSGGIDSFSVIAESLPRGSAHPRAFGLTHLLFHNVGAHGPLGEQMFRMRFNRLAPAAERMGLPFVSVNSNLNSFFGDRRMTFQQTHTLRNFAAALALQEGIGTYLYASTYAWPETFVGPTYDLAYVDAIGLPMLSTDRIEAFSVGSENTRVEKTLRVAEVAESYRSLDVCVWPDRAGNCSRCWKCMRTLLTLDVGGLLDRYAQVFDLDVYRPRRTRFVAEVIRSESPLMQEILPFARERGFPISLASRALAILPLDTLRDWKKSLQNRSSSEAKLAPAKAKRSGQLV